MPLGAFVETRTLYRGQTSHYDAVRASGWRTPFADADAMRKIRERLAAFLRGSDDVSVFMDAVRGVALDPKAKPTCARWIRDDAGLPLLANLVDHVRETVSPQWRMKLGMAALDEVEGSYLMRYQSFMFNRLHDDFFLEWEQKNLFELTDLALEFFDANRKDFDVDGRIFQVVRDLSGILQHYGVLGTPGIDLTDDLDVALWFATHEVKEDARRGHRFYEPLPPGRWGVVYTVEMPTVVFAPPPHGGKRVDILPNPYATNLGDISPLFTRIRRQHGWYGAVAQLWEHGLDFAAGVRMPYRPVYAYGSTAEIEARLSRRGLTQEHLFPPTKDDPFKAHLEKAGVETFM